MFVERLESKKNNIPQIDPETGLSFDYRNEVAPYFSTIEAYKLHIVSADTAWEDIRATHEDHQILIRPYENRYTPTEFSEVVTDKNKLKVQQIDNIAYVVEPIFSRIDRANLTPEEKISAFEKEIQPYLDQILEIYKKAA